MQLLDLMRYLIVWNPLLFLFIRFGLHWILPKNSFHKALIHDEVSRETSVHSFGRCRRCMYVCVATRRVLRSTSWRTAPASSTTLRFPCPTLGRTARAMWCRCRGDDGRQEEDKGKRGPRSSSSSSIVGKSCWVGVQIDDDHENRRQSAVARKGRGGYCSCFQVCR